MSKDAANDVATGEGGDETQSGVTALVAGERLGEARRERKIKVSEVAQELHIDEQKVRALESNDFDVIGPAVFVKGHLRKYAQLVGVKEADVMADYYELTRMDGAPPVVSAARRRHNKSGGLLILLVLLTLGAAGGAYWWFYERTPEPARPEAASPDVMPETQQEPLQSGPQNEANLANPIVDAAPSEPDVATNSVADSDVVEETTVSAPSEPSQSAVDPSQTTLAISFSGDCWSEITDAAGRRLFFDLGKAGRRVDLSGEAPFNVLFGNVRNVSISVNGSPYEIPAETLNGRTARLTIARP